MQVKHDRRCVVEGESRESCGSHVVVKLSHVQSLARVAT